MNLKSVSMAVYALGLSTAVLVSDAAVAAAIDPGDFSPAATVTTFDGLGLPIHGNTTPYELDGNTYKTDNGIFRYLGPTFCPGSCFGTDTDNGYTDITFGAPYKLVGLYVGPGANDPSATGDFWSATVDFFNTADALVGNISLSGGQPASLLFAGWENVSGIGRVRVTDTNSNGLVMLINDVTFETVVPVPAAVWLFGSGLLGLIGIARRKKA